MDRQPRQKPLNLMVGPVDDKRHDRAKEEVQEGCKERPDQRPEQHAAELLADDRRGVKNGHEVLQAHPVEQDQVIALFGVVGERHAHHVEQRQDGEDHKAGHRRGHQQHVDVFVQQTAQLLFEVGHMFAHLLQSGGAVAAADRGLPDQDQQHHDAQRSDAVQQDQLGLVACNVLVDEGLFR